MNMKVCFPVQQDEGLTSSVYNHFGSAPLFIVVDTDTNEASAITNRDQHHAHGACNPIKAIGDQKIDAVVVGGIGAGALARLNQLSVRVYRAQLPTIRENVALLLSKKLTEYTVQGCCGGHSQGGTCAH
jgi:predicted Fe-Mo cluster-binding NifX family protein